MKRIVLTVIAIIVAAGAVVLAAYALFPSVLRAFFNNANMWKYNADFESYKSDFTKVKDYVSETYSSDSKDREKWFFVSNTKDGQTLYDPDNEDYIDIPNDVRASLEAISANGFPDKDSHLYIISIYNDRVSFSIAAGVYALVYSPNEKPTWLSSPDEDKDIKVKKIGNGWYHFVVDPG